jgi:hypothetical protein
MDVFDKLFGWAWKRDGEGPDIRFGRYSDNNKSVEKVGRWNQAEQLFKDRQYTESLDAFMDYLRDDKIGNVITEWRGEMLDFRIYQGSKVVRGSCSPERFVAEVSLARMQEPIIPVMRRLLEQNFSLYYSRYALDNDRLCMRFETEREAANPNKLYYGLKELAIRSDKQDDLLLEDFRQLGPLDQEHIQPIPDPERKVKCDYFRSFIQDSLDFIATLDPDKLAGGISYLLLALAYRIDYLISPEGNHQQEMEKVIGLFYTKEEKPVLEKNSQMAEAYRKLGARPDEEIGPSLFRSISTFSIVAPQPPKVVSDSLYTAIQNMTWFRDNKQPQMAQQILEYGFSFCQYSYSLPRPMTELYQLFMRVNYPEYFRDLGFPVNLYDRARNEFNKGAVEEEVEEIITRWAPKHPLLSWKKQNIRYDSLLNFNHSFVTEVQGLNLDSPT